MYLLFSPHSALERRHNDLAKALAHELAACQQTAGTYSTVTKEMSDFQDWLSETEQLVQKKEPVVCTTKEAQDNLNKHFVSHILILNFSSNFFFN